MRAYFVEGRHVGRDDDLADLAAEAGLDRDDAWRALREDRYADAVRADEREAAGTASRRAVLRPRPQVTASPAPSPPRSSPRRSHGSTASAWPPDRDRPRSPAPRRHVPPRLPRHKGGPTDLGAVLRGDRPQAFVHRVGMLTQRPGQLGELVERRFLATGDEGDEDLAGCRTRRPAARARSPVERTREASRAARRTTCSPRRGTRTRRRGRRRPRRSRSGRDGARPEPRHPTWPRGTRSEAFVAWPVALTVNPSGPGMRWPSPGPSTISPAVFQTRHDSSQPCCGTVPGNRDFPVRPVDGTPQVGGSAATTPRGARTTRS